MTYKEKKREGLDKISTVGASSFDAQNKSIFYKTLRKGETRYEGFYTRYIPTFLACEMSVDMGLF